MRSLEEIINEKTPFVGDRIGELLPKNGERFEESLLKSNVINRQEALGILSEFYEIPHILDIAEKDIDLALVKLLPISFAKKFRLIPLQRENGKVMVAVAPPPDLYALDELGSLFGCDVQPLLALSSVIVECINKVYERGKEMSDGIEDPDVGISESELQEPRDLLEAEDEAPVIRFVNSLLFQAVKEKASDIHIECFEKDVSIRFRKDGLLHEVTTVPKRLQSSVISRVKIMSELDIAEKRKPQDGRIRVKIAGRDVDVRISTVPTTWGESVVMRLLDRSSVLLQLEDLGLVGKKHEIMNGFIHRPHGIILVTGPTGSGKTTTLYAALERINSPEKKIITIEDPVEYQIQGVNQIQVNPKVDLTFANGLRSVLRQDPDVILVGEIRDRETADIAIHASLTGHLVFSTLHTNDSASAITRLVDMGIEPFLVASSLLAVVAQRLVRLLCPFCKKASASLENELKRIGDVSKLDISKGTIYSPVGCAACLNTGYSGRAGIFEILTIDDEIRNLTLTTADSTTIKRKAVAIGMDTLRTDGAEKVLGGSTSVDEILRVTEEEGA